MKDNLLKLHGYFRSSSSWRLRTILNFKEIKYEDVFVNLLKGEHHSEEYKKINPSGLVPSLEIDGVIMIESLAIAEYLEERFPGIFKIIFIHS